ncbi:MAG: UDP-N-acetylmuramoyl-L-alanyl-D-glutamate--2,6-diaminopimelate ligase, partial [Pseudomonadota bacterium]
MQTINTCPPDQMNRFYTGIAFDSRAVQPGNLFVAIKGSHHDGADYCKQALAQGATGLLARPEVIDHWRKQPNSFARLHPDPLPERFLSLLAADRYRAQFDQIIGVTGTNGKSSVVHFLYQIWHALGLKPATIGTVGKPEGDQLCLGDLTTPDALILHQNLHRLAFEHHRHLALEASSHGLAQYRLDGLRKRLNGAIFTNLSHDHLDYHHTMEAYWQAKQRLFSELAAPGAALIFKNDAPEAEALRKLAHKHGLQSKSWCKDQGDTKSDYSLSNCIPGNDGLSANVQFGQHQVPVKARLFGHFQFENLMHALVCVHVLAAPLMRTKLISGLADIADTIRPVPGRMEPIEWLDDGGSIFVDYAHTPDALQLALQSLRAHFPGQRIVVLFGCGGNRDAAKRPLMGDIAARLSDRVYVSDDNPRDEDPAQIRAAIMAACPNACELAGRDQAIHHAISQLGSSDILLVAGKGHEQGQLIKGQRIPFDDADEIRKA